MRVLIQLPCTAPLPTVNHPTHSSQKTEIVGYESSTLNIKNYHE